ncbi:InlB B-repeat-containing protein [Acholeplasma equirhinis]|uniref:InlB B-repeat-containing protein n=1 Tax=Acholeplasma equirhinis TaxID=555393 RepID=UPI00197AB33E|nr:InlB B-repeat-containing protein [Acholeplasma equirhinis]MBN3490886.1 InlB B-repeat-containing protein [Acholeplasma equirhinis]
MKKLSILFLSLVALLFVSTYAQPAFAAEDDEATLYVQVIAPGEGMDPVEFNGTYGELTNVSFGLSGYVYHIYNGQVSDASARQFVNSKSTYVTMVLEHASDDSVVWIDTNGKVLDYAYGDAEELEYDGVTPSKPGLAFDGWQLLQSFGKNDVYVAKYQASTADVEIEILGGSADPEFPKYNEVVELTPIEGDFSYWVDEDGQFVSANPNYKFTALRPVTLQAVFGEDVPEGPSVYLYNVSGIREGYQSFVGYVENNTEATLVEFGMLASNKVEVLTLESDDVEVLPSTIMSPNNEFLRSILENEFTSFRAYAVFSDGTTVYSDNNFIIQSTSILFDFETANKTGYASDDLKMNGLDWTLNNALVGNAANDRKNGTKAARIQSTGYLELKDGIYGLTSISFFYAKYGSDNNATMTIQVKLDGGAWQNVGTPITVSSTTLALFTFDLTTQFEISSSTLVNVKISKSGGDRINVDDINLSSNLDTKLYKITVLGENKEIIDTLEVVKNSNLVGYTLVPPHGKYFIGLFKDQEYDVEFNTSSAINSHLVLFAKFDDLEQHQVTLEIGDGTSNSLNWYPTQNVFDGYYAPYPGSPTAPDNHTFVGWFTSPEGGQEFIFINTPILHDITIYAIYQELPKYTVTFDLQGGNGSIEPQTDYIGFLVEIPDNPTKDGVDFEGWYTAPTGGSEYDFNSPVNSSFTLFARWSGSAQQTYVFTSNFSVVGNDTVLNGSVFNYDITEYFTFTAKQNNSNTQGPKYFTSGSAARFYGANNGNGNSFEIKTKEGYEIVSITLLFPSSGQTAGNITAKSGTATFINNISATNNAITNSMNFIYANFTGVNSTEFIIQNTTSATTQFRLSGIIIEMVEVPQS